MKHEENVTFEFIPDGDDAWAIRILKGVYNETVIKFGAICNNGEAEWKSYFEYTIKESPVEALTVEDTDLQDFAGDVLQEIIRDAIEKDNGTIGFRETEKETQAAQAVGWFFSIIMA